MGAHVQSLGASTAPPHPLEGTLRALRYPAWQLQLQAPQPPRVLARSARDWHACRVVPGSKALLWLRCI